MEGIFDSHAHYDDPRFDEDRDRLLAGLPAAGVCGVLNVGCDAASSRSCVALARKFPFVWAAVGVHPEMAGQVLPDPAAPAGDWLGEIEGLLSEERVAAIGEIGLDYHYDSPGREVQRLVFERQLELAARTGLPVVIHSRDAAEDTLALLHKHRPRGVLHCFSGSVETAREVLELGLYLGFTGMVSFKNAKRAKAVAAMVPADRLLLETDCPYMAPEPFRGRRSDSAMIACTAAAVAEQRGVSPQEVVDAARENALRLFSLA